MKKAPLFTAFLALALLLTACGSAGGSNGSGNGGTASGNGSSFRSGVSRALTPDAKLALGTIKLEGTGEAVDAKTAAKLVPLWQLMVQLHSSTSSAPQEVTAVMDEIQATMTAQQVNTINGMSITQADLFTLFQQQAQAGSSGGANGGSGSGGNAGFGGRNRGGGGFFVAGGPGGGGFGGGGFGGGGFGGARTANGSTSSSSDPQVAAAQQAEAAQARENAISSLVEEQLIRLLETKLSSQPG